MAVSINTVTLSGRLTADPQAMSENVTRAAIACERSYRDPQSGEWKQHTDFFRLVAFNGIGNLIRKGRKGQELAISGRLSQNKYVADGQTRESIEVVVNTLAAAFVYAKPNAAPEVEEPAVVEQADGQLAVA